MKALLKTGLALFALMMPGAVMAFDYAPEGCEFIITFPEEPSSARACNPEDAKDCYMVGQFMRIYAMDSALRISSTCNRAEDGMLERYSGEVMEFTLKSMSRNKTDDPQTGYNDLGFAKQAILLGGRIGEDGSENVYMAQIWIGKDSVMTVEGEVTGADNPEADQLFSTIMGSIRHVSQTVEDDAKDENP